MQIPVLCVEDGDGDEVAVEGAEEGVDVDADAVGVAVAVDCVALGEDVAPVDAGTGVADCAA